ncbi:glycosyl hydrolase family 28-related protein [Agromyces lapidis]|uniref:Glycosyl hydrolase family 28-related protein n=1 Tax=Agromyces lapidis TaxID=279574 RepID=A0ABV5SMH8_9MICO|nr:glycosyl hydrolase family 28-related protein [Agromyces lapidis]
MANRVPAVDNSSYQLPSSVRERTRDNLFDPAEIEGAAMQSLIGSVNALSYGAVGDGVVDDSAAIQAAADAAALLGKDARLILPARTYRTTTTIEIRSNVDASQATLEYAGSGTALVLGDNASGSLTSRLVAFLPHVVKAAADWSGSSTGVRLVNLNTCEVHVPFVQGFATGLVLYGWDGGCAYNVIHLGALWQNRKNLVLDTDASGWCNQNTIIGGRLQQTLGGSATDEDASSNQIVLGLTTGAAPNNNLFLNTSLEGDNPSYYRLDVAGRFNRFVNCRWERFSAQSRVRWRATAMYNVIDGGYDADGLVETVVAGAVGNEIYDRFGAYVEATNVSGMSIPNNAFTVVTGWTVDSRRCAYDVGTGGFTPRQGRWRFTAALTYTNNATGNRRVGLYVSGAQVAVGDIPNNGSTAQAVVTMNRRFDGAEQVTVRAFQASGGALALSASANFSYVYAEYLGP